MTNFDGIRSEHAAAYGYGLILPLADSTINAACRRMLEQHRSMADRAQLLWLEAPPAEAGYSTSEPLETSGDALLFAVRLESDACEGWASQLASEDQTEEQRAFAAEALEKATVQMARWRNIIPGAPFSPLPGL